VEQNQAGPHALEPLAKDPLFLIPKRTATTRSPLPFFGELPSNWKLTAETFKNRGRTKITRSANRPFSILLNPSRKK